MTVYRQLEVNELWIFFRLDIYLSACKSTALCYGFEGEFYQSKGVRMVAFLKIIEKMKENKRFEQKEGIIQILRRI